MDANAAYAQSFGRLPHKTVFSDPMGFSGNPVDLKSADNVLQKAYARGQVNLKAQGVTSGGAGTAGYAMVPVFVDPRIIDRTRKFTPLVSMFSRVSNNGMYADFNVITAKGGAAFQVEDAVLDETSTTYDRASTAIKFMYAVGRVTGPSQAAQPSYILAGFQPAGGAAQDSAFGDQSGSNSLQQEILLKTREMKELEEDTIINGNAGTSPEKFDGVVQLLGSNNAVVKSTTAISLDDLDTAAQYAFDDGGRPNLAIASSTAFNDIKSLLSAKIGYLQSASVAEWGFTYVNLNLITGPVMLIPSMFLSNVSGSKAVYFLDMTVWEVRVLQDLTYEELAHTNDSRKFMLKQYECLICRAAAFNASVTGIA